MEFDVNNIVVIKQMPKLYEELDKIGEFIDKALEGIDEMQCTEENKTEVKNKRTEINNTLKILEEKRKAIKKAINEPYDEFNKKYEEVTKIKLQNASSLLGDKINEIEYGQKKKGEENLRAFAEEYFVKHGIKDYVSFEDMGFNITLTGLGKNLEGTTYKKEIISFCERIENELKLIDLEEYKSEILLEYQNTLDFIISKTRVIERHKELERLEALQREAEEKKKQEEVIIEKVEEVVEEVVEEEIIAPVEIEEDVAESEIFESDEYTLTFMVTGSLEQLQALKKYIIESGLKYE